MADARANFNQRTWELRVACTLLEKGLELSKLQLGGPDICVEAADGPIWFEATAPVPGDGPDAPRRVMMDKYRFGLDREAITLRYTHALIQKQRQREAFARRGLINRGPLRGRDQCR